MCQMFRVIPWRWFGFLNRNHRSTIILATTNFNSAMIGLKSSVQSASLPAQLVIVEGNIGVGKSTLACQLARKLKYRVFLEPTTKNPYLAKFYQDPKKYALKLQLWIFKQRFRTYIEATKHVLNSGQGALLDRSVFSDSVFAEVNYQQGTISDEGYQYYRDLRKQALKDVLVPHTTLYLNVSPETCSQRILGRGREYESAIPLDYLKGLDSCYKTFLDEMRHIGSSVLVYNWTDFGYKYEVAEDIKKGAVHVWSQENLQKFHRLISDTSRLRNVLTLNRTIPEAVISEDEEEQPEILNDKKANDTQSNKKLGDISSNHLVSSVEA
ncbi:deoxyguanosine kinase-like isoform X1 [Porites lutea]|uniref:deoxyguanosine kinase-like isoform X1 n=2 Tax=Porites lutea TaxID=51062 RepID=UPI003CC67C5C